MAQYNGQLGWIATASEATYGTLGTSLVYQQGISAALKQQETRTVPPCLGSTAANTGYQLAKWIAGTITLGHTDEKDDVAVIYNHCGNDDAAADTYDFGLTPGYGSLSFFLDIDSVEYDFAGCIVRGITWNLNNNDYSTMVLDVIGQSVTKYAGGARTTSIPPCDEIVVPGDLGTFTIGGANLAGCVKGATINWSWNTTDVGRQRLGTTVIPKPLRVGRNTVSATFNLELDNATSANSVAVLDTYLAGSALGDIVLDNFTLGSCVATGELPDLSGNLTDVSLSVVASSLAVTIA